MAAISSDFFGMVLLGPTETNIGGTNEPVVWPPWFPTSWRAIDNFGGIAPNYQYVEGISEWGAAQFTVTYGAGASPCVFTYSPPPGSTSQIFSNGQTTKIYGTVPGGGNFTAGTQYFIVGVSGFNFSLSLTFGGAGINSTGSAGSCQIFDWSLSDLVWPKLIANGVNNVLFSFQVIPQWASLGNAYSFTASNVSAANPCVVTATGNNFANGWKVFFTGGTVPSAFTLGTVYYVVHNGTDGTGKFRLALTSGGADISTLGQTAGASTITALDSPPASTTTLTTWVTQALTRATANGLSVKFVEGLNEANNGVRFYVGTVAELVTIQQTIYTAAKTYDSNIQVLSPPMNGVTIGGTIANIGTPIGGSNYLQAFLAAGGDAYCDIMAFHGYPSDGGTYSPVTYNTNLAAFTAMLSANGQGAKPLWNTEFSSISGTPSINETYLARTTFIDLSNNVARKYYYCWEPGTDNLWGPPTLNVPGVMNVAGVAYQQVYSWLVGLTLASSVTTAGVVQYCDFSGPGGYHARAVWTTDGSTPSYTVPSFTTQYRKLDGTSVINPGASVTIGANPIFLEGTQVSVASRNLGWYYAS